MTNTPLEPFSQWNPHALHEAVAIKTASAPEDPSELALSAKAAAFDSAVVTAGELAGLEIPVREDIVPPFFKAGDLGYVYGARGSGKSWVTLLLSNAIAGGSEFLRANGSLGRVRSCSWTVKCR